MRLLKFLIPLTILFSTASACGEEKPESPGDEAVITTVEKLECSAEAQTITMEVSASDAFEAYSNTEWVTKVDPAYTPSTKGTVRITVEENLKREPRTGEVVVKVGTTRRKVALVQAAAAEPSVPTPEGYTLVWHDEFEGTGVDSKGWKFENWNKGYVNNELQYYVAGGEFDGVETAFVKDGILNIRAQKYNGSQKFNGTTDINGQVISARMNTREAWKYGYMEARIKLPKGKGTWPAFWMMPTDQSLGWPACGEIDIMEEVGTHANYTSSSIHCKAYNHPNNTQKTAEKLTRGAEEEFHVYALEWTADYMQFYVDGSTSGCLRFENDKKGNNDTWPFNKAFYITLNLAWGGSWGGMNGVDESALPCTMQVDYVRVFQKK
jgi:beta-glucanase (GH16 family)